LLDIREILVEVVAFLIFFFLLRIFAWKKILKLLDDRKERISSEFRKIEESKAALENLRSEYGDKLKNIEYKAQENIRQAIAQGQKMGEEIKTAARQQAQKIMEEAKRDTLQEVAKAREQLKADITKLVFLATEKLLEEKVNEEKDKRIVDEFIEKVPGVE